MKRYGEAATREALANDCYIREYFGSYRIVSADHETLGYIVGDLFSKLWKERTIVRTKVEGTFCYYSFNWDMVAARARDSMTETFQVLEKSGVICDLKITNIPAAQEATQTKETKIEEGNTMKKYYTDPSTGLILTAVEAMQLHREGETVIVHRSKNNIVIITGAPQKQRNAGEENFEHCKHIALELEAYANGSMYRCPECGEIHQMPDNVGDKYRCPDCGTVSDFWNWDSCGIYDYFGDSILDMEYRVGSDRQYRSCKIMVACGGPNIYIDTDAAAVKLYWWTEYAEYPISYDTRDAVDAWAEEHWNC